MAAGIDHAFDFESFKSGFDINITKYQGSDMEFEIKGITCAMANSLRRIIISEIPTMAIEHVFIVNNTSVIQDEVLAHRLGLVPLEVDPRLFEYRGREDLPTEKNTIVLKLNVSAKRNADKSIENEKVYSNALTWLPTGSELPEETGAVFSTAQEVAVGDVPVKPVHDDILLAKLRPGQAIELEAHCTKGVGEEHAKWSPVATAWYRLYPEVVLLEEVTGQDARDLAAELPGLCTLVEGRKGGNKSNSNKGDSVVAVMDDAKEHTKLLEKVRHMSGEGRWAGKLELRKRKDHFIFTIESTGAWKPHQLFKEAVKLMVSKCDKVLEGLQAFPASGGGGGV